MICLVMLQAMIDVKILTGSLWLVSCDSLVVAENERNAGPRKAVLAIYKLSDTVNLFA